MNSMTGDQFQQPRIFRFMQKIGNQRRTGRLNGEVSSPSQDSRAGQVPVKQVEASPRIAKLVKTSFPGHTDEHPSQKISEKAHSSELPLCDTELSESNSKGACYPRLWSNTDHLLLIVT